MKKILGAAIAALVLAGSAQAQIIDISAASNVGTSVSLAAGDYTLQYTDAGAFGGWNPWGATGVSGCAANGSGCTHGWYDNFSILAGGTTYSFSSGGFFSTSAGALADAIGTPMLESINGAASASVGSFATLHLASATNVKFYVADSYYSDNVGGVSVQLASVNAVPEPSTYALLFAGLSAVGFMVRRRRG